MSFTGELEHLPIVDILQLLHMTRKSGILRFESRKGESQLVFKEGYIVSANHLNSSVRIGKILVDLGIISSETLSKALQAQLKAGRDRKPLIVTLIEMGAVREEDAYRGLEQLIELTVVEVLTWKRGTFTLDVRPTAAADEYRFYPERISREISVDTQGILMDSLRLFDEKMRDGELTDEDFAGDEEPAILLDEPENPDRTDGSRLEGEIQALFSEPAEISRDPAGPRRQAREENVPPLSMPELEELAEFLGGFQGAAECDQEPGRSVILVSPDPLFGHAVTTVCRPAGIPVTIVGDEQELDPILAEALAAGDVPILVIDAPRRDHDGFSPEEMTSLRRRKRLHYPEIGVIQLAPSGDAEFMLQSISEGARAVLPRPSLHERRATYVKDTIRFLTAFRAYLKTVAFERESFAASSIKTATARLHDFRDAGVVISTILECVAGICGRALSLVVSGSELVADQGIGIDGGTTEGTEPAQEARISLKGPSLVRDVVEWGYVHYGPADDETVRKHLFGGIGSPSRSTILLIPIRRHGLTVALVYGDFGGADPLPLDVGLLKILADQAELVLENAFYRERLSRTSRQTTT